MSLHLSKCHIVEITSEHGSANTSAHEDKSGSIYLVKS